MFGFGPKDAEMDAAEARAALESGHRMLDVREYWEFEAGHVADSVHIPLLELPSRFGELSVQDEWLVVCRSGNRSARAVSFLNGQGLKTINLHGGLQDWAREGFPVIDMNGNSGVVS